MNSVGVPTPDKLIYPINCHTYFVGLGIEVRVSRILSKHPTSEFYALLLNLYLCFVCVEEDDAFTCFKDFFELNE